MKASAAKRAVVALASGIGAFAALGAGAGFAQTLEDLAPYFGNTFISLHDDGTQYIVYWNRDGSFRLLRRGGPDPGYVMSGGFTLQDGRSCFHADHPPPGSPGCVPIELGRAPGTVWNVDGRVHELHMIIEGRQP